MKPKLLFLTKVLFCSTGLFIIWHPVSQGYTAVLKSLMSLFTSAFELSDEGDLLIYKMSLYMIPFLSLMVLTPGISLLKRAAIISTGVAAFLVLDTAYIHYLIQLQGADDSTQNAADVLFQSVKLLLPLMLWIIANPLFFKKQLHGDPA